MIERAEFETAFRDLVEEILGYAREDAAGKPMPQRARARVIDGPNGQRMVEQIVENDATSFISRIRERVWDCEALAQLAVPVASLPGMVEAGKLVTRTDGQPVPDGAVYAAKMDLWRLAHRVCAQECLDIDQQKWASALDTFWLAAMHRRGVQRIVAPILGLEVSEPLKLGEFVLRPMEPEERDELTQTIENTHGFFTLMNGPHLAKAALSYEAIVDHGHERAPIPTLMKDVLAALRLWTNAPLSMPIIKNGPGVSFGDMSKVDSHAAVTLPRPTLFAEFWTHAREVIARPSQELGVALRRFAMMHEHPRSADRLLDQVIILEALFQKGDEKQELVYRLSLRVAHFAGDTLKERERIFKLVKEAYSLRSAIAHGSKPKDADAAVVVQRDLDAVVRDVLMRYLRLAGSRREDNLHRNICDEQDRRALGRADG